MKNIARNGIVLAFIALMTAQADAEVAVETITLKKVYMHNGSVLSKNPNIRKWNSQDSSLDHIFFNDIPSGIRGQCSLLEIMLTSELRNHPVDQLTILYWNPEAVESDLQNPFLTNRFEDLLSRLQEDEGKSGFFDQLFGLPQYEKASKYKGLYEVKLSSNPTIIKKSIMRVAYELRLDYQAAKAALSDSEGEIDLVKISEQRQDIKNTEGDESDPLEKDVKLLEVSKLDAIQRIMKQYGGAYSDIANAVAAAKINERTFVFQLPDRTVDALADVTGGNFPEFGNQYSDPANVTNEMRYASERDYLVVKLDDESASHEVPADWYAQELGGHLIVGGPAVASRSMNISNGTNNTISKNNNTKEEKEEKNKGW